MTYRFLPATALVTVTIFLCTACGGGGGGGTQYGHVRLVNATRVSNLILDAEDQDDNTYSNTAAAPGDASDYTDFVAQLYSVVVSAQDSSLITSSSTALSVAGDGYYTVVAYQRGGAIRLVTLEDDEDEPNSGYAKLTGVNAGTDAGAVDVYLVPPGSSLDDRSPMLSLYGGGSSLAQSIAASTYDIVVTANSKPSDVRLIVSGVSLTSEEIVTLVLTPTIGGALLDGVLIQQQSSAELHRNTGARVRVAAGLENSGTPSAVHVSVGTSDDLGSAISPSVGTYTLVGADTSSYAVSVNGVDVIDLPAHTFAAGGDYTVLVYDSTAPKVAVLTDKNQLVSSGARIRLINAAVPSGLYLSDNYVPLFGGIAQGMASDYSSISSGTTTLSLSSPAWNGYKDLAVSISSGGVYSYFVLGTGTDETTTLSFVLNRDR